ncbi:MAG: aminodeoxychorismate synthase component I [Candidatus Omnitrophica bacterium]|nr:aminodeoxychorismate synthase component I [Candidatus Omnitrophota bacterium]
MLSATIEEIKDPPEPQEIFRSMHDRACGFFLDSACDPEKLGRYSLMGCDPFLVFRSKGDAIMLERPGRPTEKLTGNPFLVLKKLLKKYPARPVKEIPFAGGAVGYFSYDLKNFIEDLPDRPPDDLKIPDCILGFYDSVVIYDNLKKRCYISDMGITGGASKRLAKLIRAASRKGTGPEDFNPPRNVRSNFSKRSYMAAVERAKDYIRKGDIYQVNLSQRFKAVLACGAFGLYMRLRECSPAPFASYLNFGQVKILSSSPERFLFKRGGYIETRPIKGTRPRGADKVSDAAMEAELKASRKDMAEHIMIVDLERNDLGRICRYGSVGVDESAVIEKYANVFHMVSTVSGTLKDGVDPVDCLLAAFPGGSITGAPKIRSMEIIEELENVKRSVYTGAIGYIGFDGNMDTSIVIRTLLVKERDAYFQVGGGIVADSDPEKEYDETLHKAAGLIDALGLESKNKEPIPA